jgi:hypothetical protein
VDGLEAIFQAHRNVNASAAENTDPKHIANDGENCNAETVVLKVAPDAKTYSVQAGSHNPVKSFKTRQP